MTGPPAAIAVVRSALADTLAEHSLLGERILVACSGGADSLALALAASFVVSRHERGNALAVVIDHQLQAGSQQVAHTAAAQCQDLGLPSVVVPVRVSSSSTGPEDAARRARYAALAEAAREHSAAAVLVAHTRNDQAEQVLLGLLRGSGARSLSGMPSARPLVVPQRQRGARLSSQPGTDQPAVMLVRPFLGLERAITEQACADAGLQPWQDPHNEDTRYARVRARALLQRWEDEVGPAVVASLSRSAHLLRVDADTLDTLADAAYERLGPLPWDVATVQAHPEGIRTRLLRRMAHEGGSTGGSLSSTHLRAVDDLVMRWHGQGPIDLPGHVRIGRAGNSIWLEASIPS